MVGEYNDTGCNVSNKMRIDLCSFMVKITGGHTG